MTPDMNPEMISAAPENEPLKMETGIHLANPNDCRETVVETHLRLDRLAMPQSVDRIAAMSLLRTCREYRVTLKIDPDGTLVVVSNGRAWRSLVNAIEVHVDYIVKLLVAGWDATDV
jgi:hypothetical protein